MSQEIHLERNPYKLVVKKFYYKNYFARMDDEEMLLKMLREMIVDEDDGTISVYRKMHGKYVYRIMAFTLDNKPLFKEDVEWRNYGTRRRPDLVGFKEISEMPECFKIFFDYSSASASKFGVVVCLEKIK